MDEYSRIRRHRSEEVVRQFVLVKWSVLLLRFRHFFNYVWYFHPALIPCPRLSRKAFLLETYHGTQLEHPCTACIVKPPDDVCNACDFSTYDAFIEDFHNTEINDMDQASETLFSSGSGSDSSSSSSTSMGLSQDCQDCVVSHWFWFYICTPGRHGLDILLSRPPGVSMEEVDLWCLLFPPISATEPAARANLSSHSHRPLG